MSETKCASLCEWIDQNKFYAALLVIGGAVGMYYFYENDQKQVVIYCCDHCNREFKNKRTYMRHHKAKHGENENSITNGEFE